MDELRLAVFDCDGTLVDSQHAIYRSMEVAFQRHNKPAPAREAVRRIIGLPLENAIGTLAPDADAELVSRLRADYSEVWQKMRAEQTLQEPLFPGTLETLEALSDGGWLLGVATGKSYRGLVATLTHYNLLDRFVTLQTSDKVARGKPYPDMLVAALSEAGVERSNAVMIGDTTFDMDMSRSAGVRAIGVNWGYHDATDLLASGAECVLNTFEDLHLALSPKTESS